MKVQYSTASLLRATAFVAISLGGVIVWRRGSGTYWETVLTFLVFWGPVWIPLVFVAYALGRRVLTTKTVVAFAVAEGAAIAALYLRYYS